VREPFLDCSAHSGDALGTFAHPFDTGRVAARIHFDDLRAGEHRDPILHQAAQESGKWCAHIVGAETSDHRTCLNVIADLERGPEYAVARRIDESGHKLARQHSVPAEELASETLIGLTSDALIQEQITRLFKKLGHSWHFSVSTSSLRQPAEIGCSASTKAVTHVSQKQKSVSPP
jgi:hypothetical protein